MQGEHQLKAELLCGFSISDYALVPFDPFASGSTQVIPESRAMRIEKGQMIVAGEVNAAVEPVELACRERGSMYVMEDNMLHRGLANRSSKKRVFVTFSVEARKRSRQ
jgi:ectoine hydroxylase-related dioxygenase (phytanoyl-CoA dioxygenase family)